MANQEVYRIEIPIVVDDQTAKVLEQAGLRVSKFEKQVEKTKKQLDKVSRTRWQLILHAVDRASSVIDKVGAHARRVVGGTYNITLRVLDYATRPLRAIGNLATSTLGLLGIGAGGFAGIIWPTKLADDLETARIGFETMLRSAKEADVFIREIQQFAKDTPFGQAEVIELGKGLLVRGFERKDVIPMLQIIGDVAAAMGTGTVGIDRMIYAFGQMKALGKVSAEEMNQLTEAGVRAWDYLAKGMGKSIADVRKLSEQGKIAADEAIKHILAGMREYDGMMQKTASRTVRGLWGQIQDVLEMNFFTKWGQGLQDALIPELTKIERFLTANEKTIERWGDALRRTSRDATQWVVNKFEVAFEYVRTRYLENHDFQNMDFQGKVTFIIDDVLKLARQWYEKEGKSQLREVGKWLGEALADGLEGAAPRVAQAAILLAKTIGIALINAVVETLKSSRIGSIIFGMLTGAAVGSFIPGVGTLTGGLLGGLMGWTGYEVYKTAKDKIQENKETATAKALVKAMERREKVGAGEPLYSGTALTAPSKRYAGGGPILEPTLLVSMATGRPYAIAGEAGPEWVVPVSSGTKSDNQTPATNAAPATIRPALPVRNAGNGTGGRNITINGPMVQMSVTIQGIDGKITDEQLDYLAGKMADKLEEVLANYT